MIALHAAGGGPPLAVHLPHLVEQIGALAGFAAVAGLAILSALYFSQARDLKRLREWAGRAPERAAESAAAPVPGRVVAVPQHAQQPVQAPVPVTAAGAGAAPATAQPAPPGSNGAPPAGAEVAQKDEAAAEGEDQEAKPAGEGEQGGDGQQAADQKPAEGGEESDDAAADEGDKAPGKPGMPAPASAAAAAGAGAAMAASAGAGAASAAGPAAPAAAPGGAAPVGTPAEAPGGAPAGAPGGPAAKPAPQRPPTSVLPPRTGAVPPVRRIGGTAAGNPALRQSGILDPSAPERPKRNPVYIALAVVGVLVLGAGAAIGVPKLVNGGSSSKSTKKPAAARHVTKPAALRPSDITVAVLNGTQVNGAATQLGDRLQSQGFNLGTTSNAAQQQQANSVVMYSSGHEREARFVAGKLHLSAVEPADSASRGIAGDAAVIVIVGSDLAH